MSIASLLHSSASMPSLSFRPSVLGSGHGDVSLPYSSLSSYESAAALLDYPYGLPTAHTASYSSSSSSPSSSPYSLSTDESASDFDSSHWLPSAEPSLTWDGAATPAGATTKHESDDSAHAQHFLAAASSLGRHTPRLPSPPPAASSRRVSSSASSESSADHSSGSHLTSAQAAEATRQRKRKRANLTLNADERLQRRRAQHRVVDANRRQKENEAITRLHALVRQQQLLLSDGDELTAEGSVDDDDADAASRKDKAGRLTVLESSIALIEQLTTACKRMEAACNAKDAQVSSVSSRLHSVAAVIAQQASALAYGDPMHGFAPPSLQHPQPWYSTALMGHTAATAQSQLPSSHPSPSSFLSVLPPSTSSYLVQSDMSSTLRQSTASLLHSMAMAVLVLPSKVVVDVNDRFLDMVRYRRSELLHRPMGAMTMNKNIPQYPASLAAMEAVMAGTTLQGRAAWRCRWGDGLVYEQYCTFFAIYSEPFEGEASAGERRMPDKMLLIAVPGEAVVVDESDVL